MLSYNYSFNCFSFHIKKGMSFPPIHRGSGIQYFNILRTTSTSYLRFGNPVFVTHDSNLADSAHTQHPSSFHYAETGQSSLRYDLTGRNVELTVKKIKKLLIVCLCTSECFDQIVSLLQHSEVHLHRTFRG